MQALLESRCPGQALDQEYLERLKTLPTSLMAAELDQLTTSNASVASALSRVGTRHCAEFANLSSVLSDLSLCCESMNSASLEAQAAASKAPSQPAQVYSLISHLVDQDIQLYANLGHIQELIDVSSLIQTCIDSEMYAAALDLNAFVGRVASRYPKSTLIQQVSAQAEKLMVKMRDTLVKVLVESSKLQTINKASAVLRKLEPFKSGAPAAIEFLLMESRLTYMRSQLDLLAPLQSTGGSAVYVRKYVDVYRENISMTLSCISSLAVDSPAAARFVRQATKALANVLTVHLPKIAEDRARVFLQLTYCSFSLGRLGVEFWPFLESEIDDQEWFEAYKTQQELSQSTIAA